MTASRLASTLKITVWHVFLNINLCLKMLPRSNRKFHEHWKYDAALLIKKQNIFLYFLKILCLIENTFFTWLYINDYFQFVPKININWKFQNLKLFWRVHGLVLHKIWDWSHPLYRGGREGATMGQLQGYIVYTHHQYI